MPRKKPQDHAALLQRCPPGTQRVQVKDEKGKTRWRPLNELEKWDKIQFKANGIPIVAKKSPGRPVQVPNLTPEAKAILAAPSETQKKKQEFLRNDKLIKAIRTDPDGEEVLNHVLVGIGEEASSLAFERRQAEKDGNSTLQISAKRVAALRSLADTYLKKRDQMASRSLDLDSPAFQEVFKLLVLTFRKSMLAVGMAEDVADAVVSQFSQSLDADWRREAEARMKFL